MGSGMARNLLRAGHEVVVFNRSREKAEALIADGARVADSPAAACRASEAVMTMLADDQAVEQVVFGENAIASALPDGAIHISCSTISIALARRLAAEHHRDKGHDALGKCCAERRQHGADCFLRNPSLAANPLDAVDEVLTSPVHEPRRDDESRDGNQDGGVQSAACIN